NRQASERELSDIRIRSLGMQQRENQIGQEAESNERAQRIIKDHDPFSSTTVAGVGVGNRKCEQAVRKCERENVHHGELPFTLDCYCYFGVVWGRAICAKSAAQQSSAARMFPSSSMPLNRIGFPNDRARNLIEGPRKDCALTCPAHVIVNSLRLS